RQPHRKLGEAPHGRERDLVFRAGVLWDARATKSGPRDATDRDAALAGECDDTLDQALASLATARVAIVTVLDDDSARPIALEQCGDFAESPLDGLGRWLGRADTPVDQELWAVEDREAEASRDGIDGKDAFHRSCAGSDPDPEVI